MNATHLANIAGVVDRIFLAPASNRYYGRTEKVIREPEQAFDSLELNEGKILKIYLSLNNMSREKVVVGLSLQSIIWKINSSITSSSPTNSNNQNKVVLELQSYSQSCKTFNSSWKALQDQPSPFYILSMAASKDQWMVIFLFTFKKKCIHPI